MGFERKRRVRITNTLSESESEEIENVRELSRPSDTFKKE